jgi:hypothetical protein
MSLWVSARVVGAGSGRARGVGGRRPRHRPPGAWSDRLVDALCEPPETFVLGSVVAHVLRFSAHRRLLVRHLLRDAGVETDTGDPSTG